VYPEHKLGNVREKTIREMTVSPQQVKFGDDKRDTLPDYCRACDYRFACNGGCPKQRFTKTPEGEDGLNYLCAGYRMFFSHIDPHMRFMANELNGRRPAANVMDWVRQQDARRDTARAKATGRNALCPCGSGKKFKRCCGKTG
jgi:uncharacterized protein